MPQREKERKGRKEKAKESTAKMEKTGSPERMDSPNLPKSLLQRYCCYDLLCRVYQPFELFLYGHLGQEGGSLHLSALNADRDGVGFGMHESYGLSGGCAGSDKVLR